MFPTNPTSGTATPPVPGGAAEEGLKVQTEADGSTTLGLGVNNASISSVSSTDKGFIAPTEAVILDFSSNSVTYSGQTGTLSDITLHMFEDYSGADYEIYGVDGSGGFHLVTSGTMSTGVPLNVDVLGFPSNTTTLYSSYVIGVTDCALDIRSVDLTYSGNTIPPAQTPEPGTFVMAGMALIGLGAMLKKRSRKA